MEHFLTSSFISSSHQWTQCSNWSHYPDFVSHLLTDWDKHSVFTDLGADASFLDFQLTKQFKISYSSLKIPITARALDCHAIYLAHLFTCHTIGPLNFFVLLHALETVIGSTHGQLLRDRPWRNSSVILWLLTRLCNSILSAAAWTASPLKTDSHPFSFKKLQGATIFLKLHHGIYSSYPS